jgi:hypothetical protein
MVKRRSLIPVKETRRRLGNIGHTKMYDIFASGQLTALKLAGRTMVDEDEVDQLIANLPTAIEAGSIRPKHAA